MSVSLLSSVTVLVLVVAVPTTLAQMFVRNADRGPTIRQYALGKCVMTDLAPVPLNAGGYRIEITGNPDKYVPRESYRVILRGDQKFTGFALIVNVKSSTGVSFETGSFQLFRDALSRFSEGCSNAVVHTSTIPKPDIQMMYRAPSSGAGCIIFKAAVQDVTGIWHSGPNGLVKEICEAEPEIPSEALDASEECCACSEAEYDMTFEGVWSKLTHPKEFPKNEWFTHFSDIIGGSHTRDFRIFDEGNMATDGVRQVATTGFTRKLENELKSQAGKVKSIIKAKGLWHPDLNGRTSASFSVDKDNPLLSILSMLGPSPDWIVGVSGVNLCLKNCSWISDSVAELHLWDAGVANGLKYQGDNSPTVPQTSIRLITSSNPNTPDSPFFDPEGVPLKPFAKLHLRRQSVQQQSCDANNPEAGPQNQHVFRVAEGADRAECRTTNWTDWTPCSATCGKGIQMRNRQYLNEQKADMFRCEVNLLEKQMCEAHCVGDVSCQMTDWGDWADCSVMCGKGTRYRSRRYLNSKARKLCNQDLVEREPCMGPKPVCDPNDTPDPVCAVTPWSDWSPCTVTCGKGLKIRTRLYMRQQSASSCNVELMQNAPCMAEKADCAVDFMEAKNICMMPKTIGPCRGYFPRWYYDSSKRLCSQFVYGGCRGNRNNFERYVDCQTTCDAIFKDMPAGTFETSEGPEPEQPEASLFQERSFLQPVDCMVTEWSDWTPCPQTCGDGMEERRRMVKQQPANGGRECPTTLVERRQYTILNANGHETSRDSSTSSQPDICILPKVVGTCRGYFPRWFYDPRKRMCSQFVYGGCGGNQNNFERSEDCRENCEAAFKDMSAVPFQTNVGVQHQQSRVPMVQERDVPQPVDCMVTDWSNWTPCSESCGNGKKERRRMVKKAASNGGRPCPTRLVHRRRCNYDVPCP